MRRPTNCTKTASRWRFSCNLAIQGKHGKTSTLTLKMVRDLMPDDIGISVSYPLPGTPFYERVQTELARSNWYDSQDMAMLYSGPFATPFYRHLHTVVHKDYRSRKTWQTLKSLIRQPGHWRGHHARQVASMLFHRATLPLAQRKLDKLAKLPHQATDLPIGVESS